MIEKIQETQLYKYLKEKDSPFLGQIIFFCEKLGMICMSGGLDMGYQCEAELQGDLRSLYSSI